MTCGTRTPADGRRRRAVARCRAGWALGLQDDGGHADFAADPSQGAAWAERAFGAADPTDQPAIGGGYRSGTKLSAPPVNSEQLRSLQRAKTAQRNPVARAPESNVR